MDLNQEQIDQIINKKLSHMEAEYEMFKKYDNPEYSGIQNPKEEEIPQAQEPEDDSEEFGEYQEYQNMDEDSEESKEEPKEEPQEINYDNIEHIDPFSKPLDVDLIKKCMAEIQIPIPIWAQNEKDFEQHIKQMKQQQ